MSLAQSLNLHQPTVSVQSIAIFLTQQWITLHNSRTIMISDLQKCEHRVLCNCLPTQNQRSISCVVFCQIKHAKHRRLPRCIDHQEAISSKQARGVDYVGCVMVHVSRNPGINSCTQGCSLIFHDRVSLPGTTVRYLLTWLLLYWCVDKG